MLTVLKQRNFTLLWTGGLISMIGNWMLFAALPFHIYAITGSALATSGFLMAYIAPGVVFGSLAGVFVDRWDRKRTMVYTSIMQGTILMLLLFVRSAEWVWLIYVVIFIESTLGHFFSPAENALLPTLVPEEQLVTANSLNAMNDNLARLVGPALGGVLLGVVGFGSVILIDALTYVIAAILISFVGVKAIVSREEDADDRASTGLKQIWHEWVEGLRLIAHHKLLTNTFLVMGLALFADAILSAILVVFVQAEMGLSAVEFGWMMTARGIGGLIGAALVGQIGDRVRPTQLMAGGLLIAGLLLVIIVNIPVLAVALPLLVLIGIPALAWLISSYTILQQTTEDRYRGRVFGAFGTINTLLMLVGSAFAGLMADQLGSVPLLNFAALLTVFAGILAYPLLAKRSIPEPATAEIQSQ